MANRAFAEHTGPELEPERVRRGGNIWAAALSGAAAAVLAILALADVDPRWMVPLSVIGAGAALVFLGLAGAARRAGYRLARGMPTGGGAQIELIGGITGVFLGVLALVGVAEGTLPHLALIVLGGALLLASVRGGSRESRIEVPKAADVIKREGSSTLMAVGLVSLALGALALFGVAPGVLTPTGLLLLGIATALGSAALSRTQEI